MVFVLFGLPLALAGARLVLEAGNKFLDGRAVMRGIHEATEDGDVALVQLDLVVSPRDAQEILEDPRIVEGTSLAKQLKDLGALPRCGACTRAH